MPATPTTGAVRRRYGRIAPIYDRANLEGTLYADARTRAIELLECGPARAYSTSPAAPERTSP